MRLTIVTGVLLETQRFINVPMRFGERTYGESKLTLRDQLEFLGNLLRLRFRRALAWARGVAERFRRRGAGAPARLRTPPGAPLPEARAAPQAEVVLEASVGS